MKDAVRELLRVKQEVFMPLIHRVGEAQVDFGYAVVKVSSSQGKGFRELPGTKADSHESTLFSNMVQE